MRLVEEKGYVTSDAGSIDILALDEKRNFVVGWVRGNLAKAAGVRGLIIVRERDQKLEYALKEVADKVQVKRYNINFRLVEY